MANVLPEIQCSFADAKSLYSAYMPFIRGGGLFIRTQVLYELGCIVMLSLTLLNDTYYSALEGRVVWVTPIGAQGNKPAGIGVQLMGEAAPLIRCKIDLILSDVSLQSMTDTF